MSTQPISAAKLAANKANGLKSTGPRTAEGKARVSANALKHGLRSERNPLDLAADVSLPHEQTQFLETLAAFTADLAPQGPLETRLVERLAQLDLRLQRAVRMETAHMEIQMTIIYGPAGAGLPTETQARNNWLTALAFLKNPSATTLIAQYESRLSRDFARTLAQLRQSQKLREQSQRGIDEPLSRSLASDGQIAAPIDEIPPEPTSLSAQGRQANRRGEAPLCADEATEPRAQASDTSERAFGILDKQTQHSQHHPIKSAA